MDRGTPNVMNRQVLAVNAGSSSLKFALFRVGEQSERILSGNLKRIGLPGSQLVTTRTNSEPVARSVVIPDHRMALDVALESLRDVVQIASLSAVSHRVVHGGPTFSQPQLVSAELLTEVRRLCPFDPEHLPAQIDLIEAIHQRLPGVPQVACFDTAFHHGLPAVAARLPIPRRYDALGVRRYGFHGISCSFLMEELALVAPPAQRRRVILAHLGSGSSLTAVRDGLSVDTTMSFTPAAGIPMSTRSGDLDPSLAAYLMHNTGMSIDDFQRMVNQQSGLLGISETTADMQDLLTRATDDSRAQEAIDIFCYHVQKTIGAFTAVLGGLDTLVFAGGIGERSPVIRNRICAGLEVLGIGLAEEPNLADAPVISTPGSNVTVRVIHTDEEQMLARAALAVVNAPG